MGRVLKGKKVRATAFIVAFIVLGGVLFFLARDRVRPSGSGGLSQEILDVAPVETTSPTCIVLGENENYQNTIQVSVQDESLDSISVLKSENADVNIPKFKIGTSEPVVVIITKKEAVQKANVLLEAIDVSANKVECEPIVF